jgi:hypothetical protein
MNDSKLEKANIEDLIERKADLEKAVASQDYQKVIKILKYLKSIDMTIEALAGSLIGKSLKPLSTLKAPKIRGDLDGEAKEINEISAYILGKWMKLVIKPNESA